MGKSEQETASHDFTRDNVTWPIRIYPRSSIEQVSGHFVRVHDHYVLTSCVEVDEITCSDIFGNEHGQGVRGTNRNSFSILRT